jgi:23S rRNA pseudouridine955/2504/2580 synthase
LKAPITGDETYGGKPFFLSSVKRKFNLKKDTEEQPLVKRMALHAFALHFKDLSDVEHRVEAPYPKDFQALMRQMGYNKR